jgi:UDP-GlcNAc:undecaprenyl-phosphate/decaprenyl-phosphate GlcNAc-1-phosphate transferase
MSLLPYFYTFMTSLFAALIMVPFLRRWALEQGNVDTPDERKVHTAPMPRLGGVAIFLSFLFSAIVYVPMDDSVRGILAGTMIIFTTGLIDDLNGLTARRKFAGEVGACLVTILVGHLYLENLGDLFGFGAIILPPWLGIPFTIFAMVGVINAINLIDGLDGLAGGVSVISLCAFMTLGGLSHDPISTLLSAALLGGVLGFLKYNFYPARIFMGDAGSLTVGFLLGFIAIRLTQHPGSAISPMAPVIILGMPIIDTLRVMSLRVFHRENPFAPDRTHVHHTFLNLGFGHRYTVVILYGISMVWSTFAVMGRYLPGYLLLSSFLLICGLGYLLLRQLQQHPFFRTTIMPDDHRTLRQTALYLRLSDLADRGVPLIKGLLLLYALLAVISLALNSVVDWQIAALLLLVGVGLRVWGREGGGEFDMLIIYAAAGLAVIEVWHDSDPFIGGLSIKVLGDSILLVASLLAGAKLMLWKEGKFFLSTAEFLAFSVCIFLAVASHNGELGINLGGPLFRIVLLLFVIGIIQSYLGKNQHIAHKTVWLFLAIAVVIGIVQ